MKSIKVCLLLSVLAAASVNTTARAASLVVNGDFEDTTSGLGQFDYATQATGWTSDGYNFIFGSGTADTTGVTSQYGNLQLWGPNNGSANGLPNASPTGGNFVGADGAYLVGAIQQVINGLTAGEQYNVGFWWAGAQQDGFNGPTTEQWTVSLGSETIQTGIVSDGDHGFTGWTHENFTFTADGASDVLSFLAVGTPSGEPPFALLDGVTMDAATDVPEPGALGVLGVAIATLGRLVRRGGGSRAAAA